MHLEDSGRVEIWKEGMRVCANEVTRRAMICCEFLDVHGRGSCGMWCENGSGSKCSCWCGVQELPFLSHNAAL